MFSDTLSTADVAGFELLGAGGTFSVNDLRALADANNELHVGVSLPPPPSVSADEMPAGGWLRDFRSQQYLKRHQGWRNRKHSWVS